MREFLNPQECAKPLAWWRWMNGNIAKDGVKPGLERMHRIGLECFQTFDAGLSTPLVVEKRLNLHDNRLPRHLARGGESRSLLYEAIKTFARTGFGSVLSP